MRARQLIAMLLALVMIAGMCPVSVFATEVPTLQVGVSQTIELAGEDSINLSVTVEEAGYYAVQTDADGFYLYAYMGEDIWCNSFERIVEGIQYLYVELPEPGTYTLQLFNYYEWETVTLLMRRCDQPTELSLQENFYVTEGSWTNLSATTGTPWEYGAFIWTSSSDVVSLNSHGYVCSMECLAPGTAEVTVQVAGAGGAMLSASCTVIVCERWTLTVGEPREMIVSPGKYLECRFTPETTGFYYFDIETADMVMTDLYDVQAETYIDPHGINNALVYWLESGREYEVETWNYEDEEQWVSMCVKVPAVMNQGQEISVTVSEDDEQLFVFTPAESGYYYLRSNGLEVTVFNSEPAYANTTGQSDDDYLYTVFSAEAGMSYLFIVSSYDSEYTGETILLERTPEPESIDIDFYNDSPMAVGRNRWAYVHADPIYAGTAYTWRVEDESVAVITYASEYECEIEGVSAGTTTLWCEADNGLVDSVTVEVIEPTRYDMSLGETLTLELEAGEPTTFAFTAPEEGWYVFYFHDTDLSWADTWYNYFQYIDGYGAMYIRCEEGETIENTFVDDADEPIAREFTVEKTVPAETVRFESDEYYVLNGYYLYLEPSYGSILEWDGQVTYSIDNEDVVVESWYDDLQMELLAVGLGTTRVTLETAGGLTASCNVHVVEATHGELALNQPAPVRYIDGEWNFNTFTPEESGDYTISVDVPRGVYMEVYCEDYDQWAFEYFPEGTEAAMTMHFDAGVRYRIDTAVEDNDYAEGTILVAKAKADAAVVATGWSGTTQWTLTDDGVLTVYGSGKMKNYGYNGGQPWLNKGVDITRVVIEEGVTSVGSGAFRNLTTLESMSLPDTMTQMGEAAFYGTGLTAVEIPASLWTIQPYTFKNCANLTEVIFHEGNLQKISDGAFYGTGLTELVLPDCLNILDVYAFKGCASLTDITIGSGLTELREAVFYGTAIPTITIPEGITKIGPYAFKNCVELETIDLPASLKSVGEASFYACTALETVELPDAVTSIGNYAFRKCAAITDLTFGENLTTIGECAFYGCTGLTELVIPDKVTTIKPYAFKTCTGLTSVTLGESVKTIGEGAFNTCTGLKTMVFPAGLTSIGDYCFSGSYNLWKLTFRGDAPAIGTGAFKGLSATAYYPGDNATWTSAVMQNYGGKITWKAN